MTIKFGTDGWRAIIAETFTFENLERISKSEAQGLALVAFKKEWRFSRKARNSTDDY